MISQELAGKLQEAGLKDPRISEGSKVFCSNYYAPPLDQLLGEIEKRGYDYGLQRLEGKYVFMLYNRIPTGINPIYDYLADSPEEAAAQALLRILENKNE